MGFNYTITIMPLPCGEKIEFEWKAPGMLWYYHNIFIFISFLFHYFHKKIIFYNFSIISARINVGEW